MFDSVTAAEDNMKSKLSKTQNTKENLTMDGLILF